MKVKHIQTQVFKVVSHGRPSKIECHMHFLNFLDLLAHKFYVLIIFLYVLVIPTYGRLSWLALWSTCGRTEK